MVNMSITEYVRDDLAARLRSGRELPTQLTLDSLAEFYNVSFTPVRAAIAELIEEGLLEKGQNRRLIIKTENLGTPPENAEELLPLPEPPKDNYPQIVIDMVQLSLLGEEMHLREEVTAEKYGMSRSAIRNVFHRLAGEGILDHIPRRGWRLRPFRKDDLQEYVEAREALELKAMDLAWRNLQRQPLEAILKANDPNAYLEAVAQAQARLGRSGSSFETVPHRMGSSGGTVSSSSVSTDQQESSSAPPLAPTPSGSGPVSGVGVASALSAVASSSPVQGGSVSTNSYQPQPSSSASSSSTVGGMGAAGLRSQGDRLQAAPSLELLRQISSKNLPAVDESLHDYLINTADNKYIREFFQRQGRYYRLLFQWEDHDSSVALETIRQHRAVVEAMLDGDHNRARRALSNHILHNHPLLNRSSGTLI